MQLYQIDDQDFKFLKEKPFKTEKELQNIFEKNLSQLTNLTMVKSEFILKQFRFDTLAFDETKKAFVVIEYKRDKSMSIIDQGISYLNAMLQYQDSLLIEYNEQTSGSLLKRKDVDWSQTRTIFVANRFNDFQIHATNFKNLGIELLEIKRYENNVLVVNPIQRLKSAPTLPNSIHKEVKTNDPSPLTKIKATIKDYDEEYHLENKSEEIIELFNKFKLAILNLDEHINIEYTKCYVAFKKDNSNITDIIIQKNSLKMFINAKWSKLEDSKKIFRNVSNIGHLGNGDYEMTIKDDNDLEYILSVIKQLL